MVAGSDRPRRRLVVAVWVVGLGVLVAGTALAVAYLDLIPTTFSVSAVTECDTTYCPAIPVTTHELPSEHNVSLRWSVASDDAAPVGVVVFFPDGREIPQCLERGTAGACAFESTTGSYRFAASNIDPGASQLVNFTGTYLVPLL